MERGDDDHRLPPPDPADLVPGRPPPKDPPRNHPHPFRDAGHALADAAIEAEFDTGRREETIEEARAGAIRRSVRAVGGFMVIGMGIALLPLPGPGWLVIILGLSMLPFAWAERTIREIRRRIPGIPDDGRIPLSTWIVMGVLVAAFSLVAILFGGAIGEWAGGVWEDFWS